MASAVLVVLAYLIGSVSFAVIVSAVFRLPDPRSYGSGNPGATNVLRSGKKTAAALTLAGDVLKGAVAVWLARSVGPAVGAAPEVVPLSGLAAFLGHLYPIFFRFRGGKGVATAAGILFAFSVPVGLAVLSVWGVVFSLTRVSSMGALAAAIAAPIAGWYFLGAGGYLVVILAMTALLIWRHRSNIRKLRQGREGRAV